MRIQPLGRAIKPVVGGQASERMKSMLPFDTGTYQQQG
jgi:hypothetical protein